MKEQLERDIDTLKKADSIIAELKDKGIIDRDLYLDCDIERVISIVKALNTKEEREFQNKDFHVKVWQDSEKIGIETVWIREGFEYQDMIDITSQSETTIYEMVYPVFALRKLKDEILKSECRHSYSDIVTELEKADKLSREVTIWDAIKECEGVTDRDQLFEILYRYEIDLRDNGDWQCMSENVCYLDNPHTFIDDGYQLRLKEGE